MNYPAWSDLNNESVIPPLGARKAPDIGPVAVMVSCEPDLRLMQSSISSPYKKPFFISTLMTQTQCDKGVSIIGPFIGAPYAAMILDSLIAKGADTILMLGWCGAISDRCQVGDILLPTKAIADEGTSKNYTRFDKAPPVSEADPSLVDELAQWFYNEKIPARKAKIWTTDAIYRETEKKIRYYRDLGAVAVEMECSALFSVAEFRNARILSVLVVSDSVASENWEPGFRKKAFKEARRNACNVILRFADYLGENGKQHKKRS